MPDSSTVDPQPVSGSPPDLMESSKPGCEEEMEGLEELEGVELEEVRKLQELVRKLEVQNETLRKRGSKKSIPREACSNSSIGEKLSISHLAPEHNSADFSPPRDRCSDEPASVPCPVGTMLEEEVEEEEASVDFGDLNYSNGGEQTGGEDSPSQGSYESETLAESDSGLDQTALDEVDVLNLEDEYAEEEDEDSWYVTPAQPGSWLYAFKIIIFTLCCSPACILFICLQTEECLQPYDSPVTLGLHFNKRVTPLALVIYWRLIYI